MPSSSKKSRSETMGSGFEAGDLVWGKVETHPWWPGQICDEALASSSVRQTKSEGCLFVSFFGDNTYNWLQPKNLLPFEYHFLSKSNESKSKPFQEAVQEAINEVYWRELLALTCRCRNPSIDYEVRAVYPAGQVEKLRREFKPAEIVFFLHKVALGPMDLPRDGQSVRSAARILAYRKIVFAQNDPTYDEAFDSADEDPKWASNDLREALAQGAASTNYSERGAFPTLKGASSGHTWLNKACGGSKRAKVEKALDGPKVSRRVYGKASVFKNRYKCRQRNEGEDEIVDKEAPISKPSKPLTKFVPLEKALANSVGKPPLESSNKEKELALPKGAETESPKLLDKAFTEVPQYGSSSSGEGVCGSEGGRSALLSTVVNQLEDCIGNTSQQAILPSAPLPPVPAYLNVYSRQTKFGSAMNKKHPETCQTATTTTASSTADIARSILELLKEIDKHLEDLEDLK